MGKQKGQGIVEYALILAFVVSVGGLLFANVNGSLADSIRSVFSNVGTLLEEASKQPLTPVTTAKDIIERLRQGRYEDLADVLQGKPDKTLVISSDSAEGQNLARKLNIQTKEGDAWFARVQTDGITVFSYYSAEANNGMTYKQLVADYNKDSSKYYLPGIKDAAGNNNKFVIIDEGLFNNNGKSAVDSGQTYFSNVRGYVGPSPGGTGLIIDPTPTNNLK
ncbi:Flp family type IVb pilin [Mitsuokella sp. AF21-1AC]|uniref:Flp family type IVb pilin n=1 Tax=Mitsuokella sp. AF21-1AC TaxID=2292235 RepID=UPI000E515856|nr:hypothetical protein [Mitsuokella sp. AF21-1AC]RGS73977.1 hypothetical protein DWX75_03155 [Mitsuokella sp. AF21-1AC]